MDSKKSPKVANQFTCDICYYSTCKMSDYSKHITTAKHINNSKWIVMDSKKSPKVAKPFICKCGKSYKYDTGYYKHINKQTCASSNSLVIDKDFVMSILKQHSDMVKENGELKSMMIEVLKNGSHNTINSHNKTFNLQFYLNDTCKDAMNITDFVNNIQLQLSDLEKMGDIGYVNGISSIIVKKLKDMDVNSRPIHCTDVKREIMYVKDEDKWDKEENGNPKIRHAIKHIAFKNTKLLNQFKDKYPDYNNSSSRVSDNYNKILIESMGGKGDNDLEKENKIIRNITKEVTVEKE